MAGVVKGPERVQAEERVRRTYLRPQVRDYRLSPEYSRVLDDLTLDMRRENTREISARRLVERLPEETRRSIETRATEERLDLDNIRLGEPELIFFLSRISIPEAVEEARLPEELSADPIRLLRTISEGRFINEAREAGHLPTISILMDEQALMTSDPRIAEHPPEEVRRILELLRENPELGDILLRRLGLEELGELHGWELLRHIVFGLLEYRAELGRFEFESRFGRGLTIEVIAEAARLGLLYDRLEVNPRWAPEWRMIRAAYVRGQALPPDSIRWEDLDPAAGIRFLAGLRATRITEFKIDRLTFQNKIEGLVAIGTTYLEVFEGLTRQEAPLTAEEMLVVSDPKSHLTPPAVAAIIDAQAKVEVFGPIFKAVAADKPEGLREEESRAVLSGILSKETPDSTLNRTAEEEGSRRTAHDQLLAIVDFPENDLVSSAEARKLLRNSPQALYHTLRYYLREYSRALPADPGQSNAGHFLMDLLEKILNRPVTVRQAFLGAVFALAEQQIERDTLSLHKVVREKLQRLMAAALALDSPAPIPEAKLFDRDVRIFSGEDLPRSASRSEQATWEAQGRATLLLLAKIFLSPDQFGPLPFEVSAQTAMRAAEKLREMVDHEKDASLAFVPYLPAFIGARMGGKFGDTALDELKVALISGGGKGLLSSTRVVQGIAQSEIYTDLANILREIDLAELEPEIRLLGHILRSERLQKQYQDDLFALGRMLLAQMPTDLLKGLTDLIDIGQYEEVSLRVERWLKSKLDDISGFGEAPSGASAARSDS